MSDTHSKAVRSYIMSQIKGKGTKPEETVRKYLFSQGFRYRKNVKDLPGKPDVVLPRYKTVVFVNGCFWHAHNCSIFHWPRSNAEFWSNKIHANMERDLRNTKELEEAGWRVITVWECELQKDHQKETLLHLVQEIKGE